MQKFLVQIFFVMAIASLPSLAQAAETYTTCKISDGQATGYFCVRHGSTSRSGRATIRTFDRHGDLINSDWTTAVVVVMNDCEEVISLDVDDDAFFCEVDF